LCRSGLLPFSTIRNRKDAGRRAVRAAHRRRELTAKSTNSPTTLDHAGFVEVDSMLDIQNDRIKTMPSIVRCDIPAMSDDECLVRLAQAVEVYDSDHLDELARLIGRLAVTIE
jgi:hypothetical protein